MPSLISWRISIRPINYQSYDMSFDDWVTLSTLCLAPPIAHIIAGVPQVSYLCSRRPRWHQRICHYNPTSILWRYAAITDRRIRASSWDQTDMAAANALFWTATGWDGSEAMVELSLPYYSYLPKGARISVFSREILKTLIVSFQGFQSILLIASTFVGAGVPSFTLWLGLDVISFPVATIGLLRLSCGLWLTDDFAYHSLPRTVNREPSGHNNPPPGRGRWSLDSLLEGALSTCPACHGRRSSRYRQTSHWPSRLFRILYLLPVLGIWAMTIVYQLFLSEVTMTVFLALLLYSFFLGATSIILSFYFVLGDNTRTTVIPYLSSPWYQVYSLVITALAVVLVVVSCIETRRTPCGKYTSSPGYAGDLVACGTTKIDVVQVGAPRGGSFPGDFGLASTLSYNGTTAKIGQYWVSNFTGTCLGRAHYFPAHLVELLGSA